MGTSTYQIATEGNTESTYSTYIDSATGNTKCITPKRLLKGLLSTSNKPIYDTSAGTYNNKYYIKSWGYSTATAVKLTKLTYENAYGNKTSEIIITSAGNYGGYPFSTGTAFLAINSIKTITATITVTYVKTATTLSDDGVSTASLDFDNPADDTESNTNGQEPTLAGNMSRATICNNQGTTDTGCTCYAAVTANLICPCDSLTDGGSCSPVTITPVDVIDRTYVLDISVQLYNGVDSSGNDNYINIDTASLSCTVTLNTGRSDKVTLSIPTGIPFAISGTPTGAFRFKLKGNFAIGFDNTGDENGYLWATITATMPQINVVVYNPGPKCIPYQDLQYVYPLYGKTV